MWRRQGSRGLPQTLFNPHHTDDGAALGFGQLHGNEFDGVFEVRDHHVFEGVDAAAGFFGFVSEPFRFFFQFREFDEQWHDFFKGFKGGIEFAGGLEEAVI